MGGKGKVSKDKRERSFYGRERKGRRERRGKGREEGNARREGK